MGHVLIKFECANNPKSDGKAFILFKLCLTILISPRGTSMPNFNLVSIREVISQSTIYLIDSMAEHTCVHYGTFLFQ